MTDRSRRWVVFDVGETIVEETRLWSIWADELGVPRMTFLAAFGAIVERELQYQHIYEYFPVDDRDRHREAVERRLGGLRHEDLYPDVLPALAKIREHGYRTAILGNQPARRHAELRAIGVDAEVIAMSDEMGVAKPDPAFFERTLDLLGRPDPASVAYVGDRIDNDVRPSHGAGMRAVWIRRGPWGVIPREVPPQAHLVVDSLTELVERLDEAWP